jgi:hypothetical protein
MAILILLSSGCDDVKVAQGKIKPNLASAPPQEAEDASKSGSVDTQGPTAAKPRPARFEKEEETPAEKDPPIPEGAKPLNKNKTLYFETLKDGTRRVHLLSTVVLREGPLEVFLCKYQTKEHESIVDCDVDAREVHMALVAAKAVPGTPVKFSPKYTPATGSRIKVTMTYYFNGKLLNKDARYWIKDVRNKKELAHDWVFAGSRLENNPDNPQEKYYYANNGEIISLSNFPDSMLDLPIESTDKNNELMFEAWTERIPPKQTKVLITLEPVPAKR